MSLGTWNRQVAIGTRVLFWKSRSASRWAFGSSDRSVWSFHLASGYPELSLHAELWNVGSSQRLCIGFRCQSYSVLCVRWADRARLDGPLLASLNRSRRATEWTCSSSMVIRSASSSELVELLVLLFIIIIVLFWLWHVLLLARAPDELIFACVSIKISSLLRGCVDWFLNSEHFVVIGRKLGGVEINFKLIRLIMGCRLLDQKNHNIQRH